MTKRSSRASLILAILIASASHADGTLLTLQETPVGTFNGVAYTQYSGAFEGTSASGFYRVPFQITAPVDTDEGSRSVWVEPAHFAGGLGTLDAWVQRDFVLGREFSYAGVGWSSFGRSVLDRRPGFVVWIGGVMLDDDEDGAVDEDPVDGIDNDMDGAVDEDPPAPAEIADPEIISDLGSALVADAEARRLLGQVRQRYAVGFSQTSVPVRSLVTSGLAEGVFDGVLTYVNAFVFAPLQAAIAAGTYNGKVMTLNTEFDTLVFGAALLEDDGTTPGNYRHYAVPGAAHVSDPLIPGGLPSSPASYIPELRAHFWQMHQWAGRGGRTPPGSTEFARNASGAIARDAAGNALTVGLDGAAAPRAPHVELGEAVYLTGFIGNYVNVRSLADLGFASFGEYLTAFTHAAEAYKHAGLLLEEDEADMFARASLCPGSTYTENYRDRYAQFVAIDYCP